LAPILEQLGVVGAVLLGRPILQSPVLSIQGVRIHVAERHDVAPQLESAVRIAAAFSAHTDAGDVDALIGALCSQKIRSKDRGAGSKRSRFDKVTTSPEVESFLWHGR